jgi:hypothetical protein
MDWLLIHYSLPSEPSARRVYIWRKLKRLGAILLNESIWALPYTSRTREQFQWLTVEIQEMGGLAFAWKSNLLIESQENYLIEQFTSQVNDAYQKLLAKLNKKNPDLSELSKQYQQITSKDYFNSEIGKQVRAQLLSLRGGDK